LTPTPTPSPTPTSTPTPTFTPTPEPTVTRVQPSATPTPSPSPAPTAPPPELIKPEDLATFSGPDTPIELAWTSSHTLDADECYLVTLSWSQGGSRALTQTCTQGTSWQVHEVKPTLHGLADQSTDRLYTWSVRLARFENDADGNQITVPIGAPSEERSFYWR
jgi:hypothetical protein